MISFPFNENQFSFFVADHLLVGQLCTNPKRDWSLLSYLKWHNVQRARSEMRCWITHSLYQSKLWQQDHWQHPQNANQDCHELQGCAQDDENKVSGYGYDTSHLRSRLESQHQSVPGCTEECGDPLMQSGGRWQTLGVAAGLGADPQVQRDPGLVSERVLRLCALLLLVLLFPRPELAGLLRLVIRREHHQHDLPQHQSQLDRRHPPSIQRAPAGACGKGMLPVPYRGGDLGWRRLHWIDISSTT